MNNTTRTCAGCDTHIIPDPRERNRKKWCSEACRVKTYRARNPEYMERQARLAKAKAAEARAASLIANPTKPCAHCGENLAKRRDGWKYCNKPACKSAKYHADKSKKPSCAKPECDKPVQARGMCGSHYGIWHRVNNPDAYSYVCHGCGVGYTTARKARGDKTFCTANCARAYIARDPEAVIKRVATNAATYAAHPKPPKSSWDKDCAWCEQSFTAGAYHTKYCAESCKKNAAKDRRLKSLSPLRYAYEHGDNTGIIEALRGGSTMTANGCWEWKTIKDGYPRTVFGTKHVAVHRLSLEAKYGAPLGEQAAHHMCANTECVNPDHLQPVTHRENIAEMLARNSYLKRIAELEEVIKGISPNHEILNRIAMN